MLQGNRLSFFPVVALTNHLDASLVLPARFPFSLERENSYLLAGCTAPVLIRQSSPSKDMAFAPPLLSVCKITNFLQTTVKTTLSGLQPLSGSVSLGEPSTFPPKTPLVYFTLASLLGISSDRSKCSERSRSLVCCLLNGFNLFVSSTAPSPNFLEPSLRVFMQAQLTLSRSFHCFV